MPARMPNSQFNVISFLCEQLNVIDVWRYLHPDLKEYTWSNASGSLQSRIDLWLISSHTVQYVSESAHSYAPFSDHKMTVITFSDPKEQKTTVRGYWKLNCSLLTYKPFCEAVNSLSNDIFNGNEMSSIQKWEYFKFKVREIAIKHSKEMKPMPKCFD